MRQQIKQLAESLGAQVIGKIPDAGGGAFGAARLPHLIAALRGRLRPGQGLRAGRPSDPNWDQHPKVPMSKRTQRKLRKLALRASTGTRKVSPMQVAAQLLEEAVSGCSDE